MKHPFFIGALMAAASMAAQATIPEFAALDADGNGMISQEEAAKSEVVLASFAAADLDQDGNLSLDEYKALR